MNTELFISRRLFFDKTSKKFLSQKIIQIALVGIALGLAVMIISVAVVTGFKNEIRNKVIGFGSHIQVINFDSNNSYETKPILKNQYFLTDAKNIEGVETIQVFATKPGMIKTDEYIQGIVFKGVDTDYNWDFFSNNLIEGKLPLINDSTRINEIILSDLVSNLLKLKLGDLAVLYFINEKESTPRMLQLKVCGIYSTSLEEFDKLFIIGDIKQIQRLNDWSADEISGFEFVISDFGKIDDLEQEIRNTVINYSEENSSILRTNSITREYPQIFDWLTVLDMNVWVILFLMILVAGFNMISGLLVLILERSTMIGVLKALGSPNWSIRKIFLYLSVFLTTRGMMWGNIIGIAVILLQKAFHVIKLNPAVYYVDVVPVNFSILHLLLLNVGSVLITTLMLVVPSYLVSKISPDKSIRFD
ncbi:MAG: ABC transporter permease [Prolixibacteraceae bacterium]|jgi:lipoprotein-releasing system permease protein|nr:ABC transporter permease [Prolixibacteraceae bacterium]MBT6007486.1 ABC transporter permease [Prolixibacteraceae bacterium]MBT6764094.1 ABC transporter permease [Prolixibacteraceae bacterium]MBT6997308.1 ABC transporter permease [Prolixibacteraceae bacterium]MBT7395667.1 ABC transporter permease [Prolixibacteraceae bacterium]